MPTNEVTFKYLSQAQLEAAGLNMTLALEVVEKVMHLHAIGDDILPHKISIDLGEPDRGRVNIMPGYVGGDFDVCGLKWIAIFPNNPKRYGLPSLTGLMILGDPDRGTPTAVMESSLITSLRTGAASGVAAKYLAHTDSTTAAILGAGVQGRTQLLALHATLPRLSEARVYDLNAEAAEQYASEMETMLDLRVQPVANPEHCVSGADVIVTATVADDPIVKDAWVKDGSLFIHAGSNQEEEYEVVLNSDGIFVDDWPGMMHRQSQTLARMREAGLIDEAAITAELGQVISGEKVGRRSDNDRLYFCSVGMGTEDAALAQAAYRLAESKGIGTLLSLFGS
ncbi:MAG: ornithine cyclodeaminase family protein [Anaerolineales bacterium]|nr:ornithine cyclodeaminase family protein [Anaerolineales bacterium]